jgi:hypothetical protein
LRTINVWDAGREAYRQVDLDNPHDPLWDAANQLWRLNRADRRRGGHAA